MRSVTFSRRALLEGIVTVPPWITFIGFPGTPMQGVFPHAPFAPDADACKSEVHVDIAGGPVHDTADIPSLWCTRPPGDHVLHVAHQGPGRPYIAWIDEDAPEAIAWQTEDGETVIWGTHDPIDAYNLEVHVLLGYGFKPGDEEWSATADSAERYETGTRYWSRPLAELEAEQGDEGPLDKVPLDADHEGLTPWTLLS